jgi:hypothetical protein
MLDFGSRILDQRIAALFLLIKRTEYLDPVSRIQYPRYNGISTSLRLASVRVVHHRFELSTIASSDALTAFKAVLKLIFKQAPQ